MPRPPGFGWSRRCNGIRILSKNASLHHHLMISTRSCLFEMPTKMNTSTAQKTAGVATAPSPAADRHISRRRRPNEKAYLIAEDAASLLHCRATSSTSYFILPPKSSQRAPHDSRRHYRRAACIHLTHDIYVQSASSRDVE